MKLNKIFDCEICEEKELPTRRRKAHYRLHGIAYQNKKIKPSVAKEMKKIYDARRYRAEQLPRQRGCTKKAA